jgi:hypothetical protein
MYRDETRSLKQAISEISAMCNWHWLEQLVSLSELPVECRDAVRADGYHVYHEDCSWQTFEALTQESGPGRTTRYRNGVLKLNPIDASQDGLLAFQEIVRQATQMAEDGRITITNMRTTVSHSGPMVNSITIAPFQDRRIGRLGRVVPPGR